MGQVRCKIERACADCGRVDLVRADKPSVRCRSCARPPAKVANPENRLQLTCGGCSGLFTRFVSDVKNPGASYCSRGCLSAAKSVQRECKFCRSSFTTQVGRLSGKTNSSANFCSRPCYESWLCSTERTRYRGVQWHRISADLRRRTPFCAVCGRHHARLEVHHIVPYRLTRDNSPESLIVLCARHHKAVELATSDMLSLGARPEVVAHVMGARLRYRQSMTVHLLKKIAHERTHSIA